MGRINYGPYMFDRKVKDVEKQKVVVLFVYLISETQLLRHLTPKNLKIVSYA